MASKFSLFLAELKRRKVYRVAAVYAAVGAAISIAIPDLFGAFGFPEWAARLVIVIILIGFPIALVLAWAYEVRPEEPRAVEPSKEEPAPVPVTGTPAEVTATEQRKSIVVLPFDNMSPDPGDAYFADGLTEELIAELSGIRDLRVISRTTAMKLKNSDKDVATIGRELNVGHVVEGSVRKVGDALKITAQLIDATADAHLSAERYTGTMDDVFEIQERLARKIVSQLKVSLTPEEEERLGKPRISNPIAYECYLRARQHLNEFTAHATQRAIELLTKALAIEGPNELLYTTLGFANTDYTFGSRTEEVIRQEADRWASKALEMNPHSSGARALLGSILFYEGRTQEAVGEMKEVLRSDPDNDMALYYLTFIAGLSGHLDAARSYYERLQAVDPTAHGVNPSWFSFYGGRFQDSVEGFRVEWELDPESPYTRRAYGFSLAWAGNSDDACEILTSILTDSPGSRHAPFARFLIAALKGERGAAIAAMTPELEASGKRDPQNARLIASGYAMLNMVDEAVSWLRQAMSRGFINYPFLAEHEPFLASIRSEPQVQEVLSEIKDRWEAFEP